MNGFREFNLEEQKDKIVKGSIWYVDLGESNGSVQAGLRPCVVVSNRKCNEHSPVLSIVALTSRVKRGLPTHIYLSAYATSLKTRSIALCEQILTINKKQIKGYVSQLESKYIQLIDTGLMKQLELENKSYKEDNEIIKKEEELKKAKFDFEYIQEIVENIEEFIRIYSINKSGLIARMLEQHVVTLLNYCKKFNKPYELYNFKYKRYLDENEGKSKVNILLEAK